MKKSKKYWVASKKASVTDADKAMITSAFTKTIDEFKDKYISKTPDRTYNYLVDIYSTWYRHYFYLCEKNRSERPDRIADEFETKFLRLEYKGANRFDFAYFRHTGAWHMVAESLTLDECKELLLSNPVFHPIG